MGHLVFWVNWWENKYIWQRITCSGKDIENHDLVTANVVKGIMNMDVLSAASEKYLQLKDTDSMV